jgi:hypothetical protein
MVRLHTGALALDHFPRLERKAFGPQCGAVARQR